MADIPKTMQLTPMTSQELLAAYESGRRDFTQLEFQKYLVLENCELDDINLSHCWLDGTFKNVSFKNAVFYGACIKTCNFINCDLTFANFKYTSLDAIEFENVKVTHACFDYASAHSSKVKPGDMFGGLSRDPQ